MLWHVVIDMVDQAAGLCRIQQQQSGSSCRFRASFRDNLLSLLAVQCSPPPRAIQVDMFYYARLAEWAATSNVKIAVTSTVCIETQRIISYYVYQFGTLRIFNIFNALASSGFKFGRILQLLFFQCVLWCMTSLVPPLF